MCGGVSESSDRDWATVETDNINSGERKQRSVERKKQKEKSEIRISQIVS